MKQVYWMAVLLACMLAGCGGKQKSTVEEERQIFQIDSVDTRTGVQRMQVSRINQEFTCRGKKFKLVIERTPADDLPVVKSDMGTFADNRISVKILRDNNTSLYTGSFTKNDFSAHLPANFLAHSVLEGLVFDDEKTAANKEITLAASVSYPMTDLYVPFTLVISQDGKLSLAKDEDMGELTPLE